MRSEMVLLLRAPLKAALPRQQRTLFPAHLQPRCRRPLRCPPSSQSCRTSGTICLCSNVWQSNLWAPGPPVQHEDQINEQTVQGIAWGIFVLTHTHTLCVNTSVRRKYNGIIWTLYSCATWKLDCSFRCLKEGMSVTSACKTFPRKSFLSKVYFMIRNHQLTVQPRSFHFHTTYLNSLKVT